MKGIALAAVLVGACYHGAPANRDVSASWRGRTHAEIVDRWGAPMQHLDQPPVTVDVWSWSRLQFTLPDGSLGVEARPVVAAARVDAPGMAGTAGVQATTVDVHGSFTPGEIWRVHHEAAAIVDPSGVIANVDGDALHWGPPNDVNIHWGVILGAHVGMGRLDSTPTPLPSGGAYIGGMLTPTVALVGTFGLASGTSDSGSALGLADSVAVQWWPETRVWVRGGPAALLVMDPGFNNARFRAGVHAGASYAFVKVGTFALDARFDLYAAPADGFGTLGIGVNLN